MNNGLVLAAAVLTFGTALLAFLASVRNSRKLDSQRGTLDQIQISVNGRVDTLLARIEQLTATLTAAGEDVPPTPRSGPAPP